MSQSQSLSALIWSISAVVTGKIDARGLGASAAAEAA